MFPMAIVGTMGRRSNRGQAAQIGGADDPSEMAYERRHSAPLRHRRNGLPLADRGPADYQHLPRPLFRGPAAQRSVEIRADAIAQVDRADGTYLERPAAGMATHASRAAAANGHVLGLAAC